MKEVLESARLQLVNWQQRYTWPFGILLLVLLFNLAIFGLLSDAVEPENRTTGALMSIYITAGISYLVAFSQYFPFAVGLSVTRRAFYSAVVLMAVAEALAYGLVLVLCSLLERATGGWGLGVRFFNLPFLPVDNPLLQWLIYSGPFLGLAALFALIGAIFKRWGQTGVWGLTVASTLLLGGLALLLTWQNWWDDLGAWFAGQPIAALLAGYPVVLAAVALGGGWLVIRRATV